MHNADGTKGDADGTRTRQGGVSLADGTPIPSDYIKAEGTAGRMGSHLMAVVAEDTRGRLYVAASSEQVVVAQVERPAHVPDQELPYDPRNVWTPPYGLTKFTDLFTNRQLVAMTTFSDLVAEARERVLADARTAGIAEGDRLEDGGTGAAAYADAVAVYLGLAVDRLADLNNSMCSWVAAGEFLSHLFTRQAIPMIWDFAEGNPFSGSGGNLVGQIDWICRVVERLPSSPHGAVAQTDASSRPYTEVIVSTDPPYYDNIEYSDLSDFFYVWQKRSLEPILPKLFGTVLTPKADELVANPYRHDGKAGAEQFFVSGFNSVFSRIRDGYNGDADKLMTVYYAYKQQDAGADGTASTGWHTLLDGLIRAGWEITATWPVRSERSSRMLSQGTNALASSIVLACCPRDEDAPALTARRFLDLLHLELPGALRAMIRSDIAPVDLAQAAIGPGMSIFSRYSRVREANGSDMSVRDALLLINQTLDEVIDEQEADFDPDTRFAVKWYRQYGWGVESSGIADQLSRSTDTSVGALERGGIFEAKGGKARLLSPRELSASHWDVDSDERVSVWEAVVRLAAVMDSQGADQVAALLPTVGSKVSLDNVKELGVMLFHYADRKGDSADALLFNGLVTSWSDITDQAHRLASATPAGVQDALDFSEDT